LELVDGRRKVGWWLKVLVGGMQDKKERLLEEFMEIR
jgi:hypothetical protein